MTLLALSACATPTPTADDSPSPTPSLLPSPTEGEVLGQGTVLQVDDAPPQFCLGAVAESYPPQCSGPELIGWDWDAVDGDESASGVTWGTYAVWGAWDGERLTVTSSVMLALYDPMPFVDPFVDPANAGTSNEADLLAIQELLPGQAPVEVLSSWPENGYLFVQVVYDDGTGQAWADSRFGPNVVLIRPALRTGV